VQQLGDEQIRDRQYYLPNGNYHTENIALDKLHFSIRKKNDIISFELSMFIKLFVVPCNQNLLRECQ
jgi:hypothetical protein